MLDVEELLELEDNIRKELDDHLPAALSMLNRTGELETFLKMLGMEDLLQSKPLYQVYSFSKLFNDPDFYQKVQDAMAAELYKALRKD